MNNRTKTRGPRGLLLAATAGLIGVWTFTSSPVMAFSNFPSANGSCNTGDLCVWENAGPGGGLGDTPSAVADYNNVNYWGQGSSADNKTTVASSHWSTKSVTLYQNISYNVGNPGKTFCIPQGDTTQYQFSNAFMSNDMVSSHKNATGSASC